MNGAVETIKAFGYVRVSGRSQADEGRDGLPRQRDAIKRHAAAHGLTLAQVFEERGVPGATEAGNRPAWVEMLATILDSGVRTIIIEKLDRLARDLMVQEHIIADLQRRGITLVSTMEPDLCSNDPTRKLMRQIMGAIAEYDKAVLVLKLAAARKRIRDRGQRCDGAKPFGEHPKEAAVLADIRARRTGGETLEGIAQALNAAGTPARRGGKWHGRVIARLLARGA
jgi:DNA invertase Pin-like site-specific DNA recombinase